MGAGKSTIGKKLAKAMKLDFYDLDTLVSERAKCSINDIFKYLGEDFFRATERECLQDLAGKNNFVLATGGGTPCFYDNMDFIKKNGKSIYIQMDEKALYDRLIQAKNKRPLIRNFEGEDLLQFIRRALETRKHCYESSDYTIPGINPDVNEIVKILEEQKGN